MLLPIIWKVLMTVLSADPLEIAAITESLHINHSAIYLHSSFQQQHNSTMQRASLPFNSLILYSKSIFFVLNTYKMGSIR